MTILGEGERAESDQEKKSRWRLDSKTLWRRLREQLTIGRLMTAAGLGAVAWFYQTAIGDGVTAVSDYFGQHQVVILVAMPFNSSQSANEIWKAVKEAQADHCSSNSDIKRSCAKDLVLIDKADDGGDNIQARDLAKQITRNNSVVAVIGHLTSSATESALTEYCSVSDTMPLIMPISTETHIVDSAAEMGCSAILRLPPTNVQEGSKAAGLVRTLLKPQAAPATDQPNSWVGIFRDQSNPAYSNDLGVDFESSLEELNSDRNTNPKVLLDTGVGGTIGGPIVTDEVRRFQIGVLFIAGGTDTVLQTLRQAQLLNWKPSYTVLTDGALSPELLVKGKDLLSDSTYLIFPLNRDTPKVKDVEKQLGLNPNELSFVADAYDATQLILHAIDDLGQQGRSINRKNIRQMLASWKNGPPISDPDFIMQQEYEFDGMGNNRYPVVAAYHYNASIGQFEHYGDNDGLNQ